MVYFCSCHVKDEYKRKEFQLKIILKIFDYMLNSNHVFPSTLCYFLQDYSVLIFYGKEPFDEKLYNSVLDSITKRKILMRDLHYLCGATVLSVSFLFLFFCIWLQSKSFIVLHYFSRDISELTFWK